MQNNDKKVLLRISNLKQYFPLKGGRFVKFFNLIFVSFAFYHSHKNSVKTFCLFFCLSDNKVKHHIAACLTYGAARTGKRTVNDNAVFNF